MENQFQQTAWTPTSSGKIVKAVELLTKKSNKKIQKSRKIQPTIDEQSTKNRPKIDQQSTKNRSWRPLGASWGVLGRSWGVLEVTIEKGRRTGGVLVASWAFLGGQHGSNLPPKTEPKSIQNRSKNRSIFECLL